MFHGNAKSNWHGTACRVSLVLPNQGANGRAALGLTFIVRHGIIYRHFDDFPRQME
jgi:hypothetical protein